VYLTTPSHGTAREGTVKPGGELAGYNLTLDRAFLPALCLWRADGISGEFVVTDNSPDKVSFVIEPPPPPTSQPATQPASQQETQPATEPESLPAEEPQGSLDTQPL
jgi:hypothetical protein